MNNFLTKNKKAFTLIELVIVLALIGLFLLFTNPFNFNILSNEQKSEIFANKIISTLETSRDETITGKAYRKDDWSFEEIFSTNLEFGKNKKVIENEYKRKNNEKISSSSIKLPDEWEIEKIYYNDNSNEATKIIIGLYNNWKIEIFKNWENLPKINWKIFFVVNYKNARNKITFDLVSWLATKEKCKETCEIPNKKQKLSKIWEFFKL